MTASKLQAAANTACLANNASSAALDRIKWRMSSGSYESGFAIKKERATGDFIVLISKQNWIKSSEKERELIVLLATAQVIGAMKFPRRL